MSLSEEKRILLSQLVDGELPLDQANQVLAEIFAELGHVLGDVEAGVELNAMLQLRRAMNPWRQQEPPKPMAALPMPAEGLSASACRSRQNGKAVQSEWIRGKEQVRDAVPHPPPFSLALSNLVAGDHAPNVTRRLRRRRAWWALSLVSAAAIGGILASGGFLVGSRFAAQRPVAPTVAPSTIIVTPERQREIAEAFNLHESVAGPLNWYAADDSTILISPAQKSEAARQPIAVVLRLVPDASSPCDQPIPAKTYVIVCRNSDPVAIQLPPSAFAAGLRLRLLTTATGGQVKLQYFLVADGAERGLEDAALVGHRQVGLGETSLGQLALKDCLVNIDASAWVMQEERKL